MVRVEAQVALLWLPLGAGGHSVRWNGRVYEALVARREQRAPQDIVHAALEVTDDARWTIEMGPVWNVDVPERGVVAEGPVGSRLLGRWRVFRYEVRCWRDGVVPDADEAVGGPQVVSRDAAQARAVLDLVPAVPPFVWGRDALGVGDMWNSNSLVAWLLARAGHDMSLVRLPDGCRAPGWSSGLALAARQREVRPATAPAAG